MLGLLPFASDVTGGLSPSSDRYMSSHSILRKPAKKPFIIHTTPTPSTTTSSPSTNTATSASYLSLWPFSLLSSADDSSISSHLNQKTTTSHQSSTKPKSTSPKSTKCERLRKSASTRRSQRHSNGKLNRQHDKSVDTGTDLSGLASVTTPAVPVDQVDADKSGIVDPAKQSAHSQSNHLNDVSSSRHRKSQETDKSSNDNGGEDINGLVNDIKIGSGVSDTRNGDIDNQHRASLPDAKNSSDITPSEQSLQQPPSPPAPSIHSDQSNRGKDNLTTNQKPTIDRQVDSDEIRRPETPRTQMEAPPTRTEKATANIRVNTKPETPTVKSTQTTRRSPHVVTRGKTPPLISPNHLVRNPFTLPSTFHTCPLDSEYNYPQSNPTSHIIITPVSNIDNSLKVNDVTTDNIISGATSTTDVPIING